MTSKTFKSAIGKSDSRRVHIESRPEGPNLWISDNSWGSDYGITIATSDAPALALAILEAAGYQEHSKAELGSSELLASYGMTKLRQAVQAQDREESEAEAQAKLEAEALRLANEFYGADWDFFPCSRTVEMQQWLAVARRAREINKEATNGR